MNKFAISLAAVVALTLIPFTADSAQAAGRRIYVSTTGPHVHVINPYWRLHHPRFALRLATRPVVVPVTTSWSGQSVVIVPQGNHRHYVPATQPIGSWNYIGW